MIVLGKKGKCLRCCVIYQQSKANTKFQLIDSKAVARAEFLTRKQQHKLLSLSVHKLWIRFTRVHLFIQANKSNWLWAFQQLYEPVYCHLNKLQLNLLLYLFSRKKNDSFDSVPKGWVIQNVNKCDDCFFKR